MGIFADEKEMQKWLSSQLSSKDGLSSLILEQELSMAPANDQEKNVLATFKYCYQSLHQGVVISEDTNISLESGDIMRPDFLLYAPESESMVIIELKNFAGAARQTGTEISAYESELKTYLPYISDGDLINVIISPEWPTLLRHYVFNEIFWLRKNIICLEPVLDNHGEKKLKIRSVKDIVENNELLCIAEDHLGGHQICLYDHQYDVKSGTSSLDNHIQKLNAAIIAMATKGYSQNNNGFAFLWKDLRAHSQAPYSITVANFAPFQSLERFIKSDSVHDGKITKALIDVVGDYSPRGHGKSLYAICEAGTKWLTRITSPKLEGFGSWDFLRDQMMENSELISFHAWGVFGEIYSDKLAESYMNGNDTCPTCPQLGLDMLEELIDSDYEFFDISMYNYNPSAHSAFDEEAIKLLSPSDRNS
ncbi:hypothetical protein [Shewanella baltica]|uniref:hypothetical protein n=1 Tax=Shewanella baltica TaxID=62322 RepID=UPI0039AFA6AF